MPGGASRPLPAMKKGHDMDARKYEERRNELVRLIDKGLSLGPIPLPQKTVAALKEVRRKVFENQFRIVLVSGFECGKSTTLNMMCDGQEISPRGLMMPTSATVVSVQNTIDMDKVGTASVVWRTDRELTLIFAKPLLRYFKEIEPERFRGVNQAEKLADALKYPADISLVKKALRKRIADIDDISKVEQQEMDALLMAHLISEFYSDPWLAEQKRRPDFRVENIAKLICFPKDYRRKWIGEKKTPYRAEECAFVFIRQVHCFIKSENLKRTGSVLIDCPGLFASAYDTSVAFEILENADVVWYILNGVAAGESVLSAVKSIAAAKPDNIFLSVNLSGNSQIQVERAILPSYAQTLGDVMSRELKPSDFHVYHALLGLTALQARKQMDGTLDAHSKAEIIRIAEGRLDVVSGIEDALEQTAYTSLMGAYGMTLRQAAKIDLFDEDGRGIETCLEKSGVESIVSTVENEVVAKKARSILIDNGAKKAVELIQAVESDFKVAETVAEKDESDMQAEFEAAQERLDEFQKFCEEQLELLHGKSIDHSLALDYWSEVIYSSIDEVADRAAKAIAKCNLNEVRRDLNEQIINDTFAEVVKPKATAWADRIKNGRHLLFNDLVTSKMRHIIRETTRQWELVIKDQPILAGLPSPSPVIGTDVLSPELIENVVANAPGVSSDVIVGVSTGVAIGAFVGSFVFPFIGTYLGGAIGGIVGAIIGGGTGTNTREQKIYEGVRKGLLDYVGAEEQVNAVVAKQEKRMEALRLGIVKAFRKAFDKPMYALRQRHAEAQNLFAAKKRQRQEIADMHHQFRIERLEPLRLEISRFETAVEHDLKKA